MNDWELLLDLLKTCKEYDEAGPIYLPKEGYIIHIKPSWLDNYHAIREVRRTHRAEPHHISILVEGLPSFVKLHSSDKFTYKIFKQVMTNE